jgi:succinate dehydrogenase/fumarate reductase-like Fe-S protein
MERPLEAVSKMKKSLSQYYRAEKKRVLEKCVECGVCAKKCPIIKTTALKHFSLAALKP